MRPRLGSILVFVSLVVLFLPLGAIAFLRIYDTELVRQTEASLIAQGAFVQSNYRESLKNEDIDLLKYGVHFEHGEKFEIDGMTPIAPEIILDENNIFPPAPPTQKNKIESTDGPAFRAGKKIMKRMKEAQKITLSGIRVVNPKGIIVATTRGELGESILNREEVSGALQGKIMRILRQRISKHPNPAWNSVSRRTKVRVFIGMPIIEENRVVGAVILSRTPMSLQKALYNNRKLFLSFLLFITLVALSIALFTAVTIQRPMGRLITQMRSIAAGNIGEKIRNPRTKEIEELSQALVEMSQKIELRSEYISNFARTVSHEFKTPIASIHGAVELLQDHFSTMRDEERNGFLSTIDSESLRMQKLLTGLLALARADMGGAPTHKIELSGICKKVIRELKDSIKVEIETCFERDLRVRVQEEIIQTSLTNLLINAEQAGAKKVKISTYSYEGKVILEIEDNGPGIKESEIKKIFLPFYTTKREKGGTGLGLAIISSMLKNVDAKISAIRSDEGTQFRIEFKSESV